MSSTRSAPSHLPMTSPDERKRLQPWQESLTRVQPGQTSKALPTSADMDNVRGGPVSCTSTRRCRFFQPPPLPWDILLSAVDTHQAQPSLSHWATVWHKTGPRRRLPVSSLAEPHLIGGLCLFVAIDYLDPCRTSVAKYRKPGHDTTPPRPRPAAVDYSHGLG
ncbi:hypothetical protein M440DRAFT_333108 [Trichoderma longibrachiatum ATCC 18648]|uniref:Uncharacterized protein n=1 Tax=Trichoderma longibrachiatum ATCC 18648 TaxID=983965 RepID=A0A2T4C355_TRILO|nr:hypothetical protein M440DRAFT_333108 [Trichoderma longibrachiatum ATCC 18648]